MSVPSIIASKVLVERHHLHPRHAEPLALVFERCIVQKVPSGRVICDEGDAASELFILLTGRVGVKKKDYQGVSRDLAEMKAPAIFGHMALVGKSLRTATCFARTDCQIAWLSRGLFDTLMEEPGDQGRAFRWLVISSMLMQQGKGAREIQHVLGHAQRVDLESNEISKLSATLHGW
jgi:CRP-like cAMP-binding protein